MKRKQEMKVLVRGCIIDEAHVNRLQVLMEQISGVSQVLFDHLQEHFEKSAGAMAIYRVIQEKAREADKIISASFGPMTQERLLQVVSHAPDPHQDPTSPRFPQ